MGYYKAKKVDANQPAIIQAFRDVGASVEPLHFVGQGFPDILVGFRGQNWLIEIKDGSQPPSKKRLTDDETDWHRKWNGQVAIVENDHQALQLIGVID